MPKTSKYRSISLPKYLVDQIEEIIKKKKYGYSSLAEFVKDAVRRRLAELEKEELV